MPIGMICLCIYIYTGATDSVYLRWAGCFQPNRLRCTVNCCCRQSYRQTTVDPSDLICVVYYMLYLYLQFSGGIVTVAPVIVCPNMSYYE